MTHVSRHIVVAPILSAPLLTDTRRLTVGPGTREDHDAVQASGGVHRASSCRDCSVCARELQVHNFAEQRVLNDIVDSASCWAHLSEELDWSVAEPGTLVEVDLLRSVILRVQVC